MIKQYKQRVETEVEKICHEILETLDKHLIPQAADNSESCVFYLKMKGDYCRYLAECLAGDKQKKVSEEAHEAYKEATEIAENGLATTHPIRLGLALNYSVFFYEILNSPESACKLAKNAFDSAIADLEGLDDEQLALRADRYMRWFLLCEKRFRQ